MNEITIKIEGLKELTEALQTLIKAPVTGEMQSAQQPIPAAPAMQQSHIAYGTSTPQSAVPAQPPTVPVQKSMVPMQAPTMPVQQPVVPMQAPAQQEMPVLIQPAQMPPTAQMQVPTNAAPQQYSFDQLAVALSNICSKPGGQPQVHSLLQQFGVQALFDLPKEKYGEFATALRGIGGVL